MPRILVTYATRYGSTRDIAECIRNRLTDAGFDADLLQANHEIDVTKYDALIVGSPLFAGQWLADPALLLIVNKERLNTKPVALFSVGMIDVKHPGQLREQHDTWIEKLTTQSEISLDIVATGTFDGAYWRRDFPLWMRIVDRIIGVTPEGDFRNWAKIEEWADTVASRFTAALNDADATSAKTTEC